MLKFHFASMYAGRAMIFQNYIEHCYCKNKGDNDFFNEIKMFSFFA